MAKVLSGYSSLGSQESTGVFLDIDGANSGVIGANSMLRSATISNRDVDPQGIEFVVGMRLTDQSIESNRPHFEYMVASYDFDGSDYRWERVRTIDSSNNGSPIDWSQLGSGTSYLRFTAITTHEQFDRIEPWREVGASGNPAFENSWVNYGGSFQVARFRKTQDGRVHIQGFTRFGTIGSPMFTLPEGYRPSQTMVFPAASFEGYGRVDVNATGEVVAKAPTSSTWVSINIDIFVN